MKTTGKLCKRDSWVSWNAGEVSEPSSRFLLVCPCGCSSLGSDRVEALRAVLGASSGRIRCASCGALLEAFSEVEVT